MKKKNCPVFKKRLLMEYTKKTKCDLSTVTPIVNYYSTQPLAEFHGKKCNCSTI